MDATITLATAIRPVNTRGSLVCSLAAGPPVTARRKTSAIRFAMTSPFVCVMQASVITTLGQAKMTCNGEHYPCTPRYPATENSPPMSGLQAHHTALTVGLVSPITACRGDNPATTRQSARQQATRRGIYQIPNSANGTTATPSARRYAHSPVVMTATSATLCGH